MFSHLARICVKRKSEKNMEKNSQKKMKNQQKKLCWLRPLKTKIINIL